MSGFSAEWLALREPADVAARSVAVTQAVLSSLAGRTPLRVVDLGCGTGSNVRFLSSHLATRPDWRLVDHDEALLSVARAAFGRDIETRVADLRVLDPSLVEARDLVTASALLDLVSESWLERFVAACRRAGAAVLVALNYDGRMECQPHDEDDEFVRALVNRHQRTDKGFGPALGPDSGGRAADLLRAAGYEVVSATSDWVMDGTQAQLQRELVAGWAGAAIELAPAEASRIHRWQERRVAHIAAGVSRIIVGHTDVGATLQTNP